MRIYNIHNRRPEWLENPSAYKEEMKDIAHDYVMDLLKVVPDMRNNILLSDLNSMIDERTSIIDLWELDEDPKNAQERYTQDKAKCFIIENLLKFTLCYMRRYNYHLDAIEIYAFIECRYAYELDFINIDDWPVIRPSAAEDFADINLDDKCKKSYKAYYDLGDEMAKNLYKELKEKDAIESDYTEQNFLWYFGSNANRKGKQKPPLIKWQRNNKDLHGLCLLIAIYSNKNQLNVADVGWKVFKQIFASYNGANNDGIWTFASDNASKIKNRKIELSQIGTKTFAETIKALKTDQYKQIKLDDNKNA